jgi:hypothetical protein
MADIDSDLLTDAAMNLLAEEHRGLFAICSRTRCRR